MRNINFFYSMVTLFRYAFTVFNKSFFANSIVTICLITLCISLHLIPESKPLFLFKTELILQGEIWRFFMSPFIHYDADHLIWNLITLTLTSFICEQIDRRYFLYYLALAIVVTGLFKLLFYSNPMGSLGYSDIAAGGFAFLLMMVARQGRDINDLWLTVIPIIVLLLFLAYELTLFGGATPWELLTGSSLNEASGVQLKPGHIVGILTGFCFGLFRWFFIKVK